MTITDKTKLVVGDVSGTQRLVILKVTVNGEPRVELRKEWRKDESMDWLPSKGITIPLNCIPSLVEALNDSTEG